MIITMPNNIGYTEPMGFNLNKAVSLKFSGL